MGEVANINLSTEKLMFHSRKRFSENVGNLGSVVTWGRVIIILSSKALRISWQSTSMCLVHSNKIVSAIVKSVVPWVVNSVAKSKTFVWKIQQGRSSSMPEELSLGRPVLD